MTSLLRRLALDALHLIAPDLCPACGAQLRDDERGYCRACRASLDPAPLPRDIMNARAQSFGRDAFALSAIGSLYSYAPESHAQRLIHAVKYRGCYRLATEMGAELGVALSMFKEFTGVELVVPVPLHRAKLRERGFNQAAAIADGIVRTLPGVRRADSLERVRHTVSQTTLGAAARATNVDAAFRTVQNRRTMPLRGALVLVCDDVCTTGATLNACAESLLAAGARSVLAATLAVDELQSAK